MTEDPVGLASDLSMLVSGGASVAGKVAGLAGKAELASKL